jgi:K+-sensing histidine kinase KdpD
VDGDLARGGGYFLAGLGPILLAAAATPLRTYDATFWVVGALVALTVVVCARLGGIPVAAAAALVGVVSLDFFLRPPFLVLAIDGTDAAAAVVLGCVAVAAATWRPRSTREPQRGEHVSARVDRFVRLVRAGADERDLVLAVSAELMTLLRLRSCTYEPGTWTASHRRLERDGTIAGPDRVRHARDGALPDAVIELPVRAGARMLGRFLLVPSPDVTVPQDARVIAVVLADHLATAIAPPDAPVD